MPENPQTLIDASNLNSTILNKAPTLAPTAPQANLDQILSDASASWKFSDSGSGGAVLVEPSNAAATGSAIKVEGTDSVKKAEKISQMMEGFFSEAKGPQPFNAPRLTTLTAENLQQNPQLAVDLDQKLQALKNTTSADRLGKLKNTNDALSAIQNGDKDVAIAIMEMAPGKQMNKMDTQDKVALIKSDAFAQAIGRAMPVTMALKLGDHLTVDNENNPASGLTNVSNLMFDKNTGNISVIDYDTQEHMSNGKVALGTSGIDENVALMGQSLKDASQDLNSFKASVAQMSDTGPMAQGTFKSSMSAFTTAQYEDNLFPRSKKAELGDQINQLDKERFAANLMLGSADGLEYLKNNFDALAKAARATHEVQPDGTKVEHFYNEQELAAMKTELDKIDIPKIKTQLNQRVGELEIERKALVNGQINQLSNDATALTQQADHLKAKIDRLENHPSMKDKLNATFRHGGMNNYIQEQKNQLAQVQAQGSNVLDEAKGIILRESLHDQMKQQCVDAKINHLGQEKPHVAKLRDNPAFAEASAKLEAKTKQDLGIKDSPSLPGKLRDNPELAKAAKELEAKLPNAVDDTMSEDLKTPKAKISPKM